MYHIFLLVMLYQTCPKRKLPSSQLKCNMTWVAADVADFLEGLGEVEDAQLRPAVTDFLQEKLQQVVHLIQVGKYSHCSFIVWLYADAECRICMFEPVIDFGILMCTLKACTDSYNLYDVTVTA